MRPFSSRHLLPVLLLAAMCAAGLAAWTAASPRPARADESPVAGYRLVWSESFDRLDPARWRVGPDGWTDRYGDIAGWDPALVRIVDGKLRLSVERRPDGWYGGLVHSKDAAAWDSGYIEVRARMPAGRGLWSAIWLMPQENRYGYWPRSGEIDLVEFLGRPDEVRQAYSSVHFDADGRGAPGKRFRAATGTDWSQDWHTWAMHWQRPADGPISFRFLVDDVPYGEITAAEWRPAAGPGSPFDRPFHLIVNLAVGGDWAGPPDEQISGRFLEIDWIKVYRPPQ